MFIRLLPITEPGSSSDSSSVSIEDNGVENIQNINLNVTTWIPWFPWFTPKAIDWNELGYVSPPGDQGQCLSCYAFAISSSIESHNAIKHKKSHGVVKLSKQQIVDCSRSHNNFGCQGGTFDGTFQYIETSGGLEPEALYPYLTGESKCHFKSSAVVTSIKGYTKLAVGESTLQRKVGTEGPVAVAINACQSLTHYEGEIFEDLECAQSIRDLNHAVLVTGYGTENGKDYWIIKNSWGEWWGDKGYFRAARGKGVLGLGLWSYMPKV